MFNNLMVIPNVIALAALSGLVVAEIRSKKQDKNDKQ
jgi:Na+/alanine symporter